MRCLLIVVLLVDTTVCDIPIPLQILQVKVMHVDDSKSGVGYRHMLQPH